MTGYDEVHEQLLRTFGPARHQSCRCEEPALDWAYQHNSPLEQVDDLGRVYSTDLKSYSPMCRACHMKFDEERLRSKPGYTKKQSEAGKLGGEARTRRLVTDPVFAEQARETGRQNQRSKETNQLKRRCSTCGIESTPGPMSRHLKARAHAGYEEIQ